MNQIRPTASQGQLRSIMGRRRGLALLTVAATVVVMALRYQADAMRRNEVAQKNSAAPNLYVSVDRSGGGI